jgi:hypothetical protein
MKVSQEENFWREEVKESKYKRPVRRPTPESRCDQIKCTIVYKSLIMSSTHKCTSTEGKSRGQHLNLDEAG